MARYALLRETVMDLHDARSGIEDRHTPHRRKHRRK